VLYLIHCHLPFAEVMSIAAASRSSTERHGEACGMPALYDRRRFRAQGARANASGEVDIGWRNATTVCISLLQCSCRLPPIVPQDAPMSGSKKPMSNHESGRHTTCDRAAFAARDTEPCARGDLW
jgi:hypothetical protein